MKQLHGQQLLKVNNPGFLMQQATIALKKQIPGEMLSIPRDGTSGAYINLQIMEPEIIRGYWFQHYNLTYQGDKIWKSDKMFARPYSVWYVRSRNIL
jgi:hypothetical protein